MTIKPITIKLLSIGDPHFAGTGPRAYMGNYKEDLLNILFECADLSKEHKCNAVLLPGDITHSHQMSTAVLTELVEALKRFECPVMTVPGNHDRQTSNFEDLRAAPYGLMRAAGVIKDLNIRSHMVCINGVTYLLSGVGYSEKTDLEIEQYFRTPVEADIHIHLTHGLLLPDHPWWAKEGRVNPDKPLRYTTFEQLRQIPKEHRPHILVNGHYHDGHPATFIDDKTLVVNFGAVTRLSRSVCEINRTLQVGIIIIESPEKYYAEPITLKSQRPGHECLNREELVRELERDKRKDKMRDYLDLLGTKREVRVKDAREVIKQSVRELSAGGVLKAATGLTGEELPRMIEERCLGRLDKVSAAMEAGS